MARHKSSGLPMTVPCGRCIGCRLERSRQWAVRCMHEASQHSSNCFLTLTYDEDHLPAGGSLVLSHFQKFMKRLRKRADVPIRFFHCGEYGDLLSRPHYHALLFGFDFPDKTPWRSRSDHPVHRSALLEKVWTFGHSEIGTLTFESAAYVARYVTKKVSGPLAADHYERVDDETGELFNILPEYATMSRNPGIGSTWFDKYSSDVFPSDEVISNGFAAKPPRFYDQRYRDQDPDGFELVRRARALARDPGDETPERLVVREICAKASLAISPRRMDSS